MNAEGFEKAFIGGALLNGGGGVELDAAEFANETYASIWKYIQSTTVIDYVAIEQKFDKELLCLLASSVPTSINMHKVAKQVKAFAHRRRVSAALNIAINQLNNGSEISDISRSLDLAFDGAPAEEESVALKGVLREAYECIEKAYTEKSNVSFLPSGFDTIDEKIGGLQKNGLIIVAGRPAMGKTSFAMNIARNVAFRMPVLVCSMEMSRSQLGMRIMASEANLDLSKMMRGEMAGDEWSRMAGIVEDLDSCKMHVNSKACRSIQNVAAEAKRFKRKHGKMGLLVIDYLGLLEMGGSDNKAEKVSQVTRAAKIMSGESELDCPVLLLSQLNRDLEKRQDKHPMMADLRDSGAIEQDADQIIFLYRDEVYYDRNENKGLADVDFAKNRNGPTGIVPMNWNGSSTKFTDKV